jgi:hypothetical protein
VVVWPQPSGTLLREGQGILQGKLEEMSYTLWARKQGLVTPLVEKEPTPQKYRWPPHPGWFSRRRCELLLEGQTSYDNFNYGFTWRETPQGHQHWSTLAHRAVRGDHVTLSDEERVYIQHILDTGMERP